MIPARQCRAKRGKCPEGRERRWEHLTSCAGRRTLLVPPRGATGGLPHRELHCRRDDAQSGVLLARGARSRRAAAGYTPGAVGWRVRPCPSSMTDWPAVPRSTLTAPPSSTPTLASAESRTSGGTPPPRLLRLAIRLADPGAIRLADPATNSLGDPAAIHYPGLSQSPCSLTTAWNSSASSSRAGRWAPSSCLSTGASVPRSGGPARTRSRPSSCSALGSAPRGGHRPHPRVLRATRAVPHEARPWQARPLRARRRFRRWSWSWTRAPSPG
jgi:hypothetical protein